MAYNHTSNPASLQAKRSTSFSQTNPGHLFIDKSKAHIRHATPDSEALASSDDEQDFHRIGHKAPQPIRRPSWLSETNSARKSSQGANDAVSPAAIWENAPNTLARSNSNSTYSPFVGSIWNDQRHPPARLSELKNAEKQQNHSYTSDPQNSSNRRESNADGSAIPFAIPLQPTLKTYRSQSYSVGQMEEEASNNNNNNNNSATNRAIPTSFATRGRTTTGYPGAQHRPTRPSLLCGDFSPESSTVLEQVREDADDEEGSNGISEPGIRSQEAITRTMNQVAFENIMRHSQMHPASSTAQRSNSFSAQRPQVQRLAGARGHYAQESVVEEGDDDRYGDATAQALDQFASGTAIENRALENVKKGHWSSSLGFDSLQDVPQSRRHSFAAVPLRDQTNISGDASQFDGNTQALGYADANGRMHNDNASYLQNSALQRPNDAFRPTSSSSSIQQYGGIPQSPAPQFGLQPPMPSLYLVTFKAARAEFYYVHEGTGLVINAGDLVIVEADRGTDLGTVAHKNIDWSLAKELKEKYAADHYNWLMMFSRLKQGGQASPPGSSSGRPFGSAIGGMRPNPSNQPPDTGEIKPKMIKRLAQPHEIYMLREKEGNEAKAKRLCQGKVVEHHLNMEILDAEFQMDWKKLTFYYYADTYVNFNNLVTDLFKLYKTRIWMSAINPDSFVSPIPSGLPSIRGRDRPNPEGNGMMYSPMNDMQQPFGAWPAQQEAIPTPSAYSHFFTTPPGQTGQAGFNNMAVPQQDYGRNMYAGYRGPSPPTMQQQYGGAGRGQGGMGYYDAQVSDSGYPDQLRAFQGLSLEQ